MVTYRSIINIVWGKEMTTREKIADAIRKVPDRQLDALYSAIIGMIDIMKDAEDEVFCLSLAEKGELEDDGKHFSMDNVLDELQINKNDL